MPLYDATSPYFNTSVVDNFLDVMINRPIPKSVDDEYVTISAVYNLRPDMMAYDLYGDPRLWWVFAQRNPNTLVDPINDFVTGLKIYLPSGDNVRAALGL